MSTHPTCSTPIGGSVKVSVPPGWYTYVTGLSRSTHNQMIRMRITEGDITNTEYLNGDFGKANEAMKTRRDHSTSYAIKRSAENIALELACFYSTDAKKKDKLLEKSEFIVKGLTIKQAETPPHLHSEYPDYVTFFVFVQDSPNQKVTQYAPLYNDAVCTINLIKGTGLDHHGEPLDNRDGGQDGQIEHDQSNPEIDGPSLDLLFVQDCTYSQDSYIKSAKESIINICNKIASSGNLAPGGLRVGLIAFRDKGDEFVIKDFGFTSDVSVMQHNLSTLVASGGGDLPEEVTGALDTALNSAWRLDASKMIVLISDAPPHNIGEPSDYNPGNSDKNPIVLARRMAELGITLHFVACEPTLSTVFKYAYDFYKALTSITGGLVLPLVSAVGLADYIIGSSLEKLEAEALVADYGKNIARRVLFGGENPEVLTQEYFAKFSARGIELTSLDVEPVYASYPQSVDNIEVYSKWVDAKTPTPLVEVPGPRLLPKFANGGVSPAVHIIKSAITEEQTDRVVKLSVTRNAEVLPEKYIARPLSQEPVGNLTKINIPAGWFAFVSGLSRAKYNQMIKLVYNDGEDTNTEFFTSELGSTDEIMKLKRTGEGFYLFASSDDTDISLDTSFFWATSNVKGRALDKPAYVSKKLKDIETSTPMHQREDFPDYVTYFILAEDQPDSEQSPGIPDYNDAVAIVNLIKNTPMVFNAAHD